MDKWMQYLPLILPLVLIQLGLMIAALLDLRNREQVRGSKKMWIFIIILVNFLGPIFYFFLGREDE
ncbi:MAG: PLDc_N domain-containing protein [Anaerolineales bacterium]|nr:PLDc_N domain-containing protein [Anaerolineales bacterium]